MYIRFRKEEKSNVLVISMYQLSLKCLNYYKDERLTFLENPKIGGIQDLLSLAVPSDLQGRASTNPALQNYHLALRRLGILQQLHREEDAETG